MNDRYYLKLNWQEVLLKIVLLILFILLLLWLIPNPEISQFNNRIFNDNIEIMQDAARKHYTVNRLPEKVGESTSMTLEQMEAEKLVLPFTDQYNNACDKVNSFVQVTKTADDEYILKTQLSCGDQTDYVLETIGCYDLCLDGECESTCKEETIVEYEYKRESETSKTSYTCPSGYTLKNTKCYKTFESERINATAEYSEAKKEVIDATLNNGEDSLIYTDPIKVEDGFTYSCPTGYVQNGEYCYIYSDGEVTEDGELEYTCPSGYEMYGSTCYKVTEAEKVINTTCPSGYNLSSDKTQCYKVVGTATSNQTQSCPSGYSPNGSNCVKSYGATASTGGWVHAYSDTYTYSVSEYENATEKRVLSNREYRKTCGDCYTYSWYYTYSTYRRTTSYSCPSGGSLSGSTCYLYTNYITSNGASYCTAGTLVNGQCLDYKTPTVNITYTCPTGTELNGTECREPGDKTLVCPNGYENIDGKCTKKIDAEKEIDYLYVCPDGYSKQGEGENTKCYKVVGEEATYTCPDSSYTLEGNKCVKDTESKLIGYTCPAGYTLKNTNQCIKYDQAIINATAKTSTTSEWKYTWSRKDSLEGWTATGKTNEVTEIVCD